MDNARRKELKRQGKKAAEEASAVVGVYLEQANPFPVGSDEWVRGYREINENAHWFYGRETISAQDVRTRFITVPSGAVPAHPAVFFLCLACGDALHEYPSSSHQCSCGNIQIVARKPPRITILTDRFEKVGLMPKATPRPPSENNAAEQVSGGNGGQRC